MKFFSNAQCYYGFLQAALLVGTSAMPADGRYRSSMPDSRSMVGQRTVSSCNVSITGMPDGAWDSHLHVLDPVRYPPLPDAEYKPGVHTVWDNAIFEHSISCEHVVMVQPSVYGTDNTLLIESLRAYGPERARGVVVFDVADTPRAQLEDWDSIGVRGARINLQSHNTSEPIEKLKEMLKQHADAIRPFGWVLQLYARMEVIPSLETFIPTLGVRVAFDHFGYPAMPKPSGNPQNLDPYRIDGFGALVRLLQQGETWVKISGAYRLSKLPGLDYRDMDPVARELFRVVPSRLVYGSDWPHTRFEGLNIKPWNAHLLDLTEGDEELRRKLFRENARELWSSEGCSS
ncbi:4-sulfomuconolactone hydrolase [Tolypocladium ophioglossoides CBS 100239]|uniref:4-sulfomuconolactone hydrolase n=1 Tax=Tolypocladium ophioglossoides (strain CBS 100239) TaxID=1163406 RepID=A0A0L0NCM8_TOLOC|nr:4-sulfomuconolactone hydrolase [Tolypocladium ophioglossoides CBS 100239]